jgi:hypothetical protein
LASTNAARLDVFQALAGTQQPAGNKTGHLDTQKARGKKRAKLGGSAGAATWQEPAAARASGVLRRLAPLKEGDVINMLTAPVLQDNMFVEEAAFAAATEELRTLIEATEQALAEAEEEEEGKETTENKAAKHGGSATTAAWPGTRCHPTPQQQCLRR